MEARNNSHMGHLKQNFDESFSVDWYGCEVLIMLHLFSVSVILSVVKFFCAHPLLAEHRCHLSSAQEADWYFAVCFRTLHMSLEY